MKCQAADDEELAVFCQLEARRFWNLQYYFCRCGELASATSAQQQAAFCANMAMYYLTLLQEGTRT